MAVSQSYGPTLINDLCFFVLAYFHTIVRKNLELFGEKKLMQIQIKLLKVWKFWQKFETEKNNNLNNNDINLFMIIVVYLVS